MKRFVAFACIVLAGCTSIEATPGSQSIVLTANAGAVAGCRLIKQETVIVRAYEDFGEKMHEHASIKMRNAALSVGGNRVLTQGPHHMGAVNAVEMTGDIYRCQ